MKRYTTAQAISILSKPGREGWYAEADSGVSMFDERLSTLNLVLIISSRRHGPFKGRWVNGGLTIRSDWRIIKPKRDKLRRIGTIDGSLKASYNLEMEIRNLKETGGEYEIFARRVGK